MEILGLPAEPYFSTFLANVFRDLSTIFAVIKHPIGPTCTSILNPYHFKQTNYGM